MAYAPYQPDEGPKRRRRWAWAIGAGMVFTLSLPALALFVPGGANGPNATFVSAFLPLIVALPQSPFARRPFHYGERPQFDEFELAAITAGTRRAYTTVVALLAAVFLWLIVGAGISGVIVPHTSWQWAALGASLLGIILALPAFFAELTVPMPPVQNLDAEEF